MVSISYGVVSKVKQDVREWYDFLMKYKGQDVNQVIRNSFLSIRKKKYLFISPQDEAGYIFLTERDLEKIYKVLKEHS